MFGTQKNRLGTTQDMKNLNDGEPVVAKVNKQRKKIDNYLFISYN